MCSPSGVGFFPSGMALLALLELLALLARGVLVSVQVLVVVVVVAAVVMVVSRWSDKQAEAGENSSLPTGCAFAD